MSRRKISCDYERPTKCHRVAVTRILAVRTRDKHKHESQYCGEHAEIVRGDLPQGWTIRATFPIEEGVEA